MRKILLSVTVALFGITLMAQNTASLKLNLEKNKVYRFKSVTDQTILQTVNGVQQTTIAKTNSVTSIKMVDAAAEFIIAEVRFDTLITTTNAMGKIVSINSNSEGNIQSTEIADVMSCIMNRLSKNALYVKMDYSGKVIEIVNSKMLNGLILKDTSLITGQTAAATKMQIINTINDKAFKTMVEMYTYNLPSKQVVPGDKWDISMTMNSGGMSLDIITSYKLNGINGNAAAINAESNIRATENAEPMNYGGAVINYGDIKGLGKSEMEMDTHTGMLLKSTSKTHMAGNLKVNAQGFNLQIPMEIDVETNLIALK